MSSSVYCVTGQDSFVLGGVPIIDFADGDNLTILFPNDITAVKRGKNGNSIFAGNAMGGLGEVTLRIIRGSDDDKLLNALLAQQKADPASTPLLSCVFQKRAGDGSGFVANDSYIGKGGQFKKNVEALSNVEGNTDQAICVYPMIFADLQRGIL